MSGIQIDIKKTGFPVKVGEIELWFDDSMEKLANFLDAEKKLQENDLKIAEKMKKYNNIDEESMDSATANKIVELKKESISAFYEEAFGEGSFNKIYEKYPDVIELENIVVPIGKAIMDTVLERENKRMKRAESELSEIDKKRAKKK
ncbi:hypothetical protein [Oceanobacillus alkalisoli]|uniref:hypothetical protein n=1 Tax=Oceanobacillus alkalisoli TaxID=2925113 RepID=UPI001EE3E8A4|nr:hypothetical protein [Oceanobacillus alkalisoli]MCG5104451.1 hypothetical protein [Oceanobacillus alkalisoli]